MSNHPGLPIGVPKFRMAELRATCVNQCYLNSLPAWDELFEGVFPRGARPTDVDGMVELNRHFLFLEEKGAGVDPPSGQSMALGRLALNDGFTVCMWRPGLCSEVEVRVMTGDGTSKWQPGTRSQLKAWFRKWGDQAENYVPPVRWRQP